MLGLSIRKHIKKIAVGAVLVLGLVFVSSTLISQPSFAVPPVAPAAPTAPVVAPTPTAPGSTSPAQNAKDPATNCAVSSIGWILCPIINASAKISDKTFDILANNFLQTDPNLVGDNSGTKTAWDIARNIANVMFIIAFLVIIVSQVTGLGITNYGIKKMIPKLIIAAIAVNVSYYICQLAVDLTNILGYEIENALTSIANGIGPSVFGTASQYGVTQNGTGGGDTLLVVIAGAALAVAGAVWLALPLVMGIIGFVFITALTIIIILLLRKAIIVLLVVISPIAFVMYLLPNTEKLFSRWMKMFGQLLMVFPVVGLLFGAGQLASTIILVSGAQTGPQATAAASCNADDTKAVKAFSTTKTSDGSLPGAYDDCGVQSVNISGTKDGGNACAAPATGTTTVTTSGNCMQKTTASWTLGLVATGVAVAPLLAVWSVLKGALSAAGAIGGKINSVGSKLSSGSRGRMKASIDNSNKRVGANMQTRLQNMQARGVSGKGSRLDSLVGQSAERKARREHRNALSKSGLESEERAYVDRLYTQNAAGEMTSGLSDRGLRAATSVADKAQIEEMNAASLQVRTLSDDDVRAQANSSSDVNDPMVAAAVQELAKRQDFPGLEAVINRVGQSGEAGLVTRTLSSSISQHASGLLTGGQLGAMERGDMDGDYASTVSKNLAGGIFTAENISTAGPALLIEATRMATSTEARARLGNAAQAARSDPILSKRIGRNADILTDLAKHSTTPPVGP